MIEIQEFGPELLIFVAGIVQSLFFEYVPRVAPWFASLGDVQKRAVQAGLLLLVTVGIFALACAEIVAGVACDQAGIVNGLVVYFFALMANQTTHRVFRKKRAE